MKFEKISYSESIETINAFGTKKWFKSGTEITDINDEVTRATQMAKEYVAETIKASLEANPSYVADPTTFTSKTSFIPPANMPLPVIQKEVFEPESLEDQMKSCTDPVVLASYQALVKLTKDQKIQATYDRLMMELKYKQSVA